jgi:hypothetical protein
MTDVEKAHKAESAEAGKMKSPRREKRQVFPDANAKCIPNKGQRSVAPPPNMLQKCTHSNDSNLRGITGVVSRKLVEIEWQREGVYIRATRGRAFVQVLVILIIH